MNPKGLRKARYIVGQTAGVFEITGYAGWRTPAEGQSTAGVHHYLVRCTTCGTERVEHQGKILQNEKQGSTYCALCPNEVKKRLRAEKKARDTAKPRDPGVGQELWRMALGQRK